MVEILHHLLVSFPAGGFRNHPQYQHLMNKAKRHWPPEGRGFRRMGGGIAMCFVQKGVPVVLKDAKQEFYAHIRHCLGNRRGLLLVELPFG